ncbi:Hydroxyacylglutathione hydrolase cytoplasmic [Ancistrocladus abbreviatus]
MKILHIPCLQDNYAYLVIDETTKEAAAVDPVEPEKILEVAKQNDAKLKMVLTTHHHWDHAGGNEKMRQLVPGIKVFGGSLDNVKGCTDKVDNGDRISLGAEVSILCLHTPCLLLAVVNFLRAQQNRCISHFVLHWLHCLNPLKFSVVMSTL